MAIDYLLQILHNLYVAPAYAKTLRLRESLVGVAEVQGKRVAVVIPAEVTVEVAAGINPEKTMEIF